MQPQLQLPRRRFRTSLRNWQGLSTQATGSWRSMWPQLQLSSRRLLTRLHSWLRCPISPHVTIGWQGQRLFFVATAFHGGRTQGSDASSGASAYAATSTAGRAVLARFVCRRRVCHSSRTHRTAGPDEVRICPRRMHRYTGCSMSTCRPQAWTRASSRISGNSCKWVPKPESTLTLPPRLTAFLCTHPPLPLPRVPTLLTLHCLL